MVLVALIFVVATVFHILSTPLYLLLGLAVATAAISYWSDQLGMKLGKKRITLMGLRPRQTATLISILSSLAIMIVTLAVMLLVYEPLRNALFRFDSERERNRQLVEKSQVLENNNAQQQQSIADRTRKNDLLSRELNKQNKELQLLGVRVEKSQRALSKAGENLRTAQVARNNAESARRGAEAARNEAQSAQIRAQGAQSAAERARQIAQSGLAQAQQREAAAQRRTTQAQQRYAQAQARLSAANARLRSAQSSVKRAQREVIRAEQEKVRTQSVLARTRSDLTATNTQRVEAERQQQRAIEGAKDAVNALKIAISNRVQAQTELEQTQTQLSQTRTQLTQLQRELEGTQRDLSFANLALSDPSKIVVTLNQTLGAATLPANASEQQAREVLTELLSQGRRKVRQDGFESLYLAPVLIGEVELGEEQIIPTLARNLLSRAANPYSIRLLAARDHALGETEIVTRLLAIEVKTAFEKGEVLAETTIEVGQDNASSDARIFNQLFRLVDGAGRAKADERRVVPLLTVETPNFFAPDTNLRIFEAMREIQELGTGRRVTVKLVAADTLTTIESPSVRFKID